MLSRDGRIAQLDLLVGLGLCLVPMRPGTKIPKVAWKDGGCDYRQVADSITAEPPANLAVITGAASSGLLVIDADRHGGPDGCATMRCWEQEHDRLPLTTTVLTPHDGVHIWYHVDDVTGLGDAVCPELGVDIRCGGLALVPPSEIDGVPYRYADGRSPEEVGIADVDGNVMSLVATLMAKAPRKASRPEAPAVVTAGGRNDSVFRYCCHVREMGGDETDVCIAAIIYNQVFCRPQLPGGEVVRTAASACRYPRGVNGFAEASMLPDPGTPGGVTDD